MNQFQTTSHLFSIQPQCPCPQSIVPGAQCIVHITPVQSGAAYLGTQLEGWQHVAGTQSESVLHSKAVSLFPASLATHPEIRIITRINIAVFFIRYIGVWSLKILIPIQYIQTIQKRAETNRLFLSCFYFQLKPKLRFSTNGRKSSSFSEVNFISWWISLRHKSL